MAGPSTDPNPDTKDTAVASASADDVEVEMETVNPAAEEDQEDEEEEEEEEEDEEEEEEEESEPEPEPEAEADAALVTETPAASAAGEVQKWPGWPGDNVFRLVVPVTKVGGIIGKKGDVIKKLCEETRARIRILSCADGTTDRIVLISAKEEPEAEISPAMDAVLRVFKCINSISETGEDGTTQATIPTCSVRLLVASSQAINLIGKQGSSIKLIQESSGAKVRVLAGDELPYCTNTDERIIDILGDSSKVLKALEGVVGHLRKFLVDHGVLPLFEKTLTKPAAQGHTVDSWADKTQSLMSTSQQPAIGNEYQFPLKRDSIFLDHESPLDSQMQRPGFSSLYGQDTHLPVSRFSSSGLGRSAGAIVTKVTQTMQIPLAYAEDIIGVRGGNIAYIRRASGAALTVQESGGLPDEITVEIKGTSNQVQTAQQLIQDCIAGRKEPTSSGYEGGLETGLRSTYSHLGSTVYPSSSYGGYSSEFGGYESRYRY